VRARKKHGAQYNGVMNEMKTYTAVGHVQLVFGEHTVSDPKPFGFLVRAGNESCAMEEILTHVPDSPFHRVCVLILDVGGAVLERYSDDDYHFFNESEAAALN
jgi:hypothetical protein